MNFLFHDKFYSGMTFDLIVLAIYLTVLQFKGDCGGTNHFETVRILI